MKKHKIKQHVVHANGYTINYHYINTNVYTQYTKNNYNRSGYSAYSNRSNWGENWRKYSNWADWRDTWSDGGWPNTYGNGGWSEHRNGYSNGGYGAYSNHTNYTQAANQNSYSKATYTEETGRTPQNVINAGPTLSGNPTPNSGIINRNVVTLDWNGVTYGDDGTSAATKYRVYYSYCATQNGTYGNWTLLSEQTAKTYNWTITNVAKGYYKIAVTAYDGASWSALPSGATWTFHYIDNTTASTHVDPGSTIKTISYALGGPVKIVHYDPPTWLNEYYTKAAMDQLVEETNKARTAFDLSSYSFTTTSYVSNFTIITLQDFADLNTANNQTYNLYKGTNYTFTSGINTSGATNSQQIVNQAITDIRNLIDHLKN